ncbi:MAG TPA: hypothetical protein VJ836_04675 [Candidatus Saccharimonadales bacterium]|nr:hypothetical protein [Candidatus Saccharimonadales bacterium]
MRHPVGNSQNGIAIYVDLIHSDAAKHISRQPYLLGLAGEALRQTTLQGPEAILEYNMGRTIGYNFVVNTKATDNIFYAQLVREKTYTRFVKNGQPDSTQYLTLILRRNEDDNTYELHDAWIGHLCPPQPGSTNETSESRQYWANHAFVLDNQPLQMRTVTRVCPY